MGANPVVETPDGVVEPIIPEGTPTLPTLVLDTATVPGSSFTFTTRIEREMLGFIYFLLTNRKISKIILSYYWNNANIINWNTETPGRR